MHWRIWWKARSFELALEVRSIPVADQTDWHTTQQGWFKRSDGRYFTVEMRRVTARDGTNYTKPTIVQAPSVAVMIRDVAGRWLLQAKAEDGALARTQQVYLGATIQVSATNFGERKFAFGGYMERVEWLTDENQCFVDPGRIDGSCRLGIIVLEPSGLTVGEHANHRWFTTSEIEEALHQGIPFSVHFWTIMGLWRHRQSFKGAVNSHPR